MTRDDCECKKSVKTREGAIEALEDVQRAVEFDAMPGDHPWELIEQVKAFLSSPCAYGEPIVVVKGWTTQRSLDEHRNIERMPGIWYEPPMGQGGTHKIPVEVLVFALPAGEKS